MDGATLIDRYTLRARNVLAARGTFTALFEAYLEHARRWVGEPDGLVHAMMRQGLAAAALYLTCRPTDEHTAWTLNLPEPPLNIFFSADASRDRVVGCHFLENVQAGPHSRLFVQLARSRGEPHLSVIEVTGFDVLDILERYYVQSEQATARFFELPGQVFLMLMALPGVDEPWLREVTPEEARALLDGADSRWLERRTVVFGCACDEERIRAIAAGIFRNQLDELFGSDAAAEIRCPRCGRAFTISRDALERALADAPPDPPPAG
jgi:hypothetical protein